jgi:hypothetical protein
MSEDWTKNVQAGATSVHEGVLLRAFNVSTVLESLLLQAVLEVLEVGGTPVYAFLTVGCLQTLICKVNTI